MHTEREASSNLQTPQTDNFPSSSSATPLQNLEPLSTSPSGLEQEANAAQETVQSIELEIFPPQNTVQSTDLGSLPSEEQRAVQHTQAMTPGIDALRKRRTKPAEHQQDLTPTQDPASLLKQPEQQRDAYPPAEPSDAAASSTISSSTRSPSLAESATIQPDRPMPVAGSQAIDDYKQSNQALGTNASEALTSAGNSDGPAGGAGSESSSAEQPQQSQKLRDEAEYENLLDAIAEGILDWEPPTQQAAAPSQSVSFSFKQMQLHSEEAARKQQLQQQQRRQQHQEQKQQQQQQQKEQEPLLPRNSNGNADAVSTAPVDRPLQEAPVTANSDTEASTSKFSQPVVMPGSNHQQGMPGTSQHTAGLKTDQHVDDSDVSQNSGVAQHEALGNKATGDRADAPHLSPDVVVRSSRLRLRRASPALQARKKASKAHAGKALPSKPPTPLTSPWGTPQGTMQETKWRVIKSEQTTAEEFVKRPADVDRQRPAWATNAASAPEEDAALASEDNAAFVSRGNATEEAAQGQEQVDKSSSPPVGRALTKQELRALAARRGLDFERLLADALARGIAVSD